ncbi:MAG: DUF6713 family protein [Rubrobacteraceae bacterium]
MPEHFFFFLGLSLLLAHEMDAVRVREWKIFPMLNNLRDEAGYVVFTALHVPIYVLLLWGLSGAGSVSRGLVFGLDVFFVVHAILHLVFHNHPENRFRSAFSYALIFGAGLSGVADLLFS